MIVAAFIGGAFVGTFAGLVVAGLLSAGARADLMDEIVRLNNDDYPNTHPRPLP